ncbi:hypothetical protein AB0H83_08150 [Dactylosporangium sp. NPDC050688]|uniref:hypothetical protein n=1 Tax=Dactylosporangium sp. NPDC050688 TaxID=3157217 RepID=UPI0033DA0F96
MTDMTPERAVPVPPDGRVAADDALHSLLLRLAGHLPDPVLTAARDRLAAGLRGEAVRAVAFEALAQPLPLAYDEIDLLRAELRTGAPGGGGDPALAAALDEVRGERHPAPWLFQSTLATEPTTRPATAPARGSAPKPASKRARFGPDPALARPLDLTGADEEELDPVDRALVAFARDTAGVRALWRAWRMPAGSHAWHAPVRVVVLAVTPAAGHLPALAGAVRAVLAAAGDHNGQAEVYRASRDMLHRLYYQTLARCCGALLWADRPPAPVAVAPVFDGADEAGIPWFAPSRPVVADPGARLWLLRALRAAPVLVWSSSGMTDVLAPHTGAVVPRHLRSDGTWVWSDAVAFYLEQYGLAPDPRLAAHLNWPDAGPPDEIAVHRAMVHVFERGPDSMTWYAPSRPTRTR